MPVCSQQCGNNKEEIEKLLKMCNDYKARKVCCAAFCVLVFLVQLAYLQVTLDQLHQFLQQQYNLKTQATPPPPPPPPPVSSLAPQMPLPAPTSQQLPAVVAGGRGSRQPRVKRGRDQ